ncbi:MAG: hypothetical protein WCJ05_00730 [bacterium]
MDNQNQQLNQTSGVPVAPAPAPITASSTVSNRAKIAAKLNESYNILVTVSNNPTVDQLTALLGFTLLMGKMKKHASAVFSGEIPPIIQFLEPEKTIEKNTDSLQDFIIAIDKAKADKLRYKVEDNLVRIFITPYKTSISEHDLNFTLGDLNVDVIVALGVKKQEEIDQAIMAHGKILHDATIIALSNTPEPLTIGNLNWVDTTASSLSEMVTLIANDLGAKDLIDGQIATSWLTGIVSSTKRFANEKTSPTSLSVSAQLLSSGANQRLVADQLEPKPASAPAPVQATLPPVIDVRSQGVTPTSGPTSLIKSADQKKTEAEAKANLGELDIEHADDPSASTQEEIEKIRIDDRGTLHKLGDESETEPAKPPVITPQPGALNYQPPVVSNPLTTTNSRQGGYLSNPPASTQDSVPNNAAFEEKPSTGQDSHNNYILSSQKPAPVNQIPNPIIQNSQPSPSLESARQAVNLAPQVDHRVPAAFNALPLGNDLHPKTNSFPGQTMSMPLPTNLVPPTQVPNMAPTSVPGAPSAPPPIPPPMINPTPPTS